MNVDAAWLTQHGFAIASIDYWLTDVVQRHSQIDDCYAAVRWVRENSDQHKIDLIRVGAWGTSAGGHLVALMGTRPCPDSSEKVLSRVQAVCDWFGPTELLTMPPNNICNGRAEADIAQSKRAKLLGATVRDIPKLAMDASAISDLGPVGQSWNRSSLSHSRGLPYAHTIRELICIGKECCS